MFRVRAIEKTDLNALVSLVAQDRTGIITLTKNPDQLKQRLDWSTSSFNEAVSSPANHYYLFVLEDCDQGEILGICGIYARTPRPLEYFRLKESVPNPIFPEIPKKLQILERVHYPEGPTEIGSLFMSPIARHKGLGKLLSFSRFLFMAAFPERFSSIIFADMRGIIHEDGNSPFWDGVGRCFLPIDFQEFIKRLPQHAEAISTIMPIYPLYVNLLEPQVPPAIGAVHPNTRPALHMLLKQGFKKTGEVDLYDGGPRIVAERNQITLIQNAKKSCAAIEPVLKSTTTALLAKPSINFRATLCPISIHDNAVSISQKTAQILELSQGEKILYALL